MVSEYTAEDFANARFAESDKYPIMAAMFRDYAKTALTAAIEGEQ